MKPRLLLDVDGVLNAFPFNHTDEDNPWPDVRKAKVLGFPISWSPSLVDRLLTLAASVEVLWLTTWEHHAQEHLAPALRLPEWELAGVDPNPHDAYSTWWKLDVARDLYERDLRPFIWIDDDYAFMSTASAWLESLPEGVALAISPNSCYGITPTHLALIETFINTHSQKEHHD